MTTNYIKQTDELVERFDDLFLAGKFKEACDLLGELDLQQMPPQVISAILMITKAAENELGEARINFIVRARKALSDKIDADRVNSIIQRHS